MKRINTDKAPAAVGPYSQAVEINNVLYLSGQIPLNPETGKLVEGDIKEQTHRVMKNIQAVLESEGLGLEHVVKTLNLLDNIEDFAAFNEVYGEYFTHKPARSAFEAAALPLGAGVEVEVIAVRPE